MCVFEESFRFFYAIIQPNLGCQKKITDRPIYESESLQWIGLRELSPSDSQAVVAWEEYDMQLDYNTQVGNTIAYSFKYSMEPESTDGKPIKRQLSSDCNTLELTNGKATSLLGLSDNQISTNSYLSNNVVLRLLFKLLNPCPLSLIITIVIAAILPRSQAYPLWMYIAEFAMILLLLIVKEVYFDMMRRRADEKVNKSKFLFQDSKIYRDGEEITGLCWGDIRQGDILYLQKGEKAPADILVLDTQHIQDREAVVYVDARSITGRVTVERKKACYLTQVTSRSAIKRNWDKYKKEYLTGKLKYELPNAYMQDFLGYLKLVKDPKTSLITFQNFISRESIIKTCWIYALVLHAGMNCKIMRHIGERNRNHKFFENYIDRIFVACFIINVILGLPYALVSLTNQVLNTLETSVYHFLIFSVILPHFLYFGNGLLLLYFSFKNNIDADIINFSSIINLGSIDFAVIAYNGVLSSGKMIADEIITSSSLYDFREEVSEPYMRGSRRNGSLSGSIKEKPIETKLKDKRNNKFFMSICNSGTNGTSPAQKQYQQNNEFDTYFLDDDYKQDTNNRLYTGLHPINPTKFKMQLEPLRISKEKLSINIKNEEEESMELVKAFGMCHQAILKSIDAQDIKFQANSRIYSEEVLLRLVNGIGVHVASQIDARSKKEVGLKLKILQANKEMFFSRRINNFQIQRKIFSVVVREQGFQQRTIYCKGTPEDMFEKLRDRQLKKNILENKLSAFKNTKAEIIVYGKRVLSNSEYDIYQAQFTKLKMSSTVTQKDLEEFSSRFQKDLEFVCMVGLSSEKSQAAKKMASYLTEKGIKMCIFTNNNAEIQSLKSLLRGQDEDARVEYIQLEGITVQEITYNLNSITRKLSSEKEYIFSLVVGPKCWKHLSIHTSLMQHFLFVVYYSHNILTQGFSPQQKAEITEKLKSSFNRNHTLMSIGSSYSDLLFENYSDVSLIINSFDKERTRSDIPSDIRAPTIESLRKIIQLGSWVTSAYNYLIDAAIYRSIVIFSVAFTIQTIVYASQGTSYNLNGVLTALYIVVYGAIETMFTIKIEQKKGKSQMYEKVKEKEYWIKFATNIIQAIIHGVTISVVVLMTLPNARFSDGKLFPIQTFHFCVYFLLINVSIFRHIIHGECSKFAVGMLALISYPILLGILWFLAAFSPTYYKIAVQMGWIWTVYDSAFMCINAMIFSLACSLYISQTRKKGMITMLADYYLNLKKGQGGRSKQLLAKDINHIDLVKHLFVDVDNIQESIQELVGAEYDTNQLKINELLEIKKVEHRIKNQFNNVPLNLSRFKITGFAACFLIIAEIIFSEIYEHPHISEFLPLYFALACILIGLGLLVRQGQNLGRKYYNGAQICLQIFCILLIIYEIVRPSSSEHFLLACCSFLIFTQLSGIRLQIVVGLCIASLITSIIISSILEPSKSQLSLQIFLSCVCVAVNIGVLYGSTFDSRKNFILREQIEMQTNQTNDIWTILVPEFVRNFFSQAGEQGGQYRQNSVAILFCYVCNFDSIIQEQGRNVVRILDDLYRQFDKLCSSFAVQKIETVGYTYMAATGIKKIESQMQNQMVRRNKVERLLGMAQQMLDKTKMFKWGTKKNKDLDIKIGIHVGEVVVGVIGKHKKQFSLIGTNVNTTSRHGSTGGNGSITLSREAKNQVHFPDEAFIKKEVYMKGLCKEAHETIPVYTLKVEEAARRTNSKSNGYRLKFKELVMKIIRSQRLSDQKSSDDGHLLANIINVNQPPQIELNLNNSARDLKRRTTCRGLENNFNKIEEMKNRQDEIKCYSSLLEFDPARAREHFLDSYPGKNEEQVQGLLAKQEQLQRFYHIDLQKNRGFRDKLFILILISLNVAYLVTNIIEYTSPPYQIATRIIGLALLTLLLWLTSYFHKYGCINKLFVGVFIYCLIVQKYDEVNTYSSAGRTFSHFYVMMIITMFSGISGVRFIHSVWMVSIAIISGIIALIFQNQLEINTIYEWFYITLVLIRKYAFQKESIINFRQGRKTAQISNELSKIVSELLPKHAYEKLKTQNFENRLELTDLFQQCTILFADIKGFTEFSDRAENRRQPQNVVRMLRSLFEEFDVLCTEKNVYKVYTIGDCYVVLGFTNCYDRNPIKEAQNVLSFAFDMLKKIEQVKKEKPALDCLNMRIGIHTGTIIGGIVGTEIVRYDIYGSDVVVANKFQETGKTGEVHISEQTKKLLDQLQKKPYSENNIYPSEKVEVKKLNISYGGYLIKRGNLS